MAEPIKRPIKTAAQMRVWWQKRQKERQDKYNPQNTIKGIIKQGLQYPCACSAECQGCILGIRYIHEGVAKDMKCTKQEKYLLLPAADLCIRDVFSSPNFTDSKILAKRNGQTYMPQRKANAIIRKMLREILCGSNVSEAMSKHFTEEVALMQRLQRIRIADWRRLQKQKEKERKTCCCRAD